MRYHRKAATMTKHPGLWKVKPEPNGNGTVAIFTGHARRTASADVVLGDRLASIVDETEGALRLDFRDVEFLHSDDIARLVNLWKKLKKDGRQLGLCNVKPIVYQVFQIIRLHELMEIQGQLPLFSVGNKREALNKSELVQPFFMAEKRQKSLPRNPKPTASPLISRKK